MTQCEYIREARFIMGEVVIKGNYSENITHTTIVEPLNYRLRELGYGAAYFHSSVPKKKIYKISLKFIFHKLELGLKEAQNILESLNVPKYSFIELYVHEIVPHYDVNNNIKSVSYNFKEEIKIWLKGEEDVIESEYGQKDDSPKVQITNEEANNLIIWADKYKLANKDNDIDPWFPRNKNEMLKLTNIMLEDVGLEEIPKELFRLQNINHIHLANNKLSSIPKEIKNLNYLKYFNISGNCFTQFPSSVLECENIESLDISNNAITILPQNFYHSFPKIYKLDISNNNLTYILPKITSLKSLEILIASYQKLENIPEELFNLRKLRELDFSNNAIKLIPVEIKNAITLDNINLNHNKIDSIPKEISKLKILNSLKLKKNPIKLIPNECMWMLDECVIEIK